MDLPTRSDVIAVRRATVADIPSITALARVTWLAHYPGIISFQQIFYMLSERYAPNVLRDEIQGADIVYFVAVLDGEIVGLSSSGLCAEPGEYKLHKLYILPAFQRRGLGRRLIEAAESEARLRSANCLVLNVNKKNVGAQEAYEKCGFKRREAVCLDIGNGFFMDDFILTKAL